MLVDNPNYQLAVFSKDGSSLVNTVPVDSALFEITAYDDTVNSNHGKLCPLVTGNIYLQFFFIFKTEFHSLNFILKIYNRCSTVLSRMHHPRLFWTVH